MRPSCTKMKNQLHKLGKFFSLSDFFKSFENRLVPIVKNTNKSNRKQHKNLCSNYV